METREQKSHIIHRFTGLGDGSGIGAEGVTAPECMGPEQPEIGSAAVASVDVAASGPDETPTLSAEKTGTCEEAPGLNPGTVCTHEAAESNPRGMAPPMRSPEGTAGHQVPDGVPPVSRAQVTHGGLKSWTAAEVTRTTPAEVAWIARPWVAKGAITLVDGKPKSAGKSTWLAHMVKSVLSGTEFLDEPTARTPVVLLTEERPVTLRRMLDRVGLAGATDLHVVFFNEVPPGPWRDLVKWAADRCREVGARLLIIDTLHQFAGIPENSSRKALEAIRPLQAAAEQGLAVVAVRHERKSGGAVGDSGRGSSATTGAADIVVALQRPANYTGPGRIIHTLSRYEETPSTMTIELGAEGYIVREEFDVGVQAVERALLLAVPDTEADAKTADELMAETGLKKTAVREALARMVKEGKLMQTGTGRKNAPYRYWWLVTA